MKGAAPFGGRGIEPEGRGEAGAIHTIAYVRGRPQGNGPAFHFSDTILLSLPKSNEGLQTHRVTVLFIDVDLHYRICQFMRRRICARAKSHRLVPWKCEE